MKKYLLIMPLIIIFCVGTALAWLNMGANQPAVSTTCTLYQEWTSTDGNAAFGRISTQEYGGMDWLDAVQGGTICQVDVYVNDGAGSSGQNDLYAEIWTVDGNDDMAAYQARSDKVDDNSAWSNEWVTFTFSTPFVYSKDVDYAIVFKSIDNGDPATTPGENDGTNYTKLNYDNFASRPAAFGRRGLWDMDGATPYPDDITYDSALCLKVYTMQ